MGWSGPGPSKGFEKDLPERSTINMLSPGQRFGVDVLACVDTIFLSLLNGSRAVSDTGPLKKT